MQLHEMIDTVEKLERIEHLKKLITLMKENHITKLNIDGIDIQMDLNRLDQETTNPIESKNKTEKTQKEIDEEILFYSAGD